VVRRPSIKTLKKAVTAIRKLTGHGRKKRGGFLGDFFNTLSKPETWGERLSNEILNPNSVSKQLGLEAARVAKAVNGMGRRRGRGRVTTMPYFG
jgi:hypothetical protein